MEDIKFEEIFLEEISSPKEAGFALGLGCAGGFGFGC